MIKSEGILVFSPEDKTRKHKSQSSWKRVAMIKTNDDLSEYYAWFLKSRFGLVLNKPLRGSHITIISDRMDNNIFNEASKLFNKKKIRFEYDPANLRSNDKHWWINISSTDAENIRSSMGLSKTPYFGFHLSLGYANERNFDHSEYIKRQLIKFNI